jgi:hypothetical protein
MEEYIMKGRKIYPDIDCVISQIAFTELYQITISSWVRFERNGKYYFILAACSTEGRLEYIPNVIKDFCKDCYMIPLHIDIERMPKRQGRNMYEEDTSSLTEKDRTYFKYISKSL